MATIVNTVVEAIHDRAGNNTSYTSDGGTYFVGAIYAIVVAANDIPSSVTLRGEAAVLVVGIKNATGDRAVSIWRCELTGGGIGSGSITANFAAGQSRCQFQSTEIGNGRDDGTDGEFAFRTTASATGNSATPSVSLAGSRRHAGNGAFAAVVSDNGADAFSFVGVGYNNFGEGRVAGEAQRLAVGSQGGSAPDNQTFAPTLPAAHQWAAVIVELNAVAEWADGPSDSAGGTDSIARAVSAARTATDSAPATETVARSFAGARALADSAGATDSLASVRNLVRSLSDSAPASEALLRSVLASRGIADTVTGSDALARLLVLTRGLSDSAPASDTIARAVARARELVDSAPASDTLADLRTLTRSISDSAGATDALEAVLGISAGISDSAGATDSLSRTWTGSRGVADDAPATDSLAKIAAFFRILEDSAGATDVLDHDQAGVAVLVDSAPAIDTVSRAWSGSRTLVEEIAIGVDTVVGFFRAPETLEPTDFLVAAHKLAIMLDADVSDVIVAAYATAVLVDPHDVDLEASPARTELEVSS